MFDVYCLIKYVKFVGKDQELVEKLFYFYYMDVKLISDYDILVDIVELVGMNRDEFMVVFYDFFKYVSEVCLDEVIVK